MQRTFVKNYALAKQETRKRMEKDEKTDMSFCYVKVSTDSA